MAQKFVGIDLGNRTVKVAVISAGIRGAHVLDVWEKRVEPTKRRRPDDESPSDPLDPAIDTALRMLNEHGLRRLPTGIALPGGSGSYRVLSFPFDDPRQIAEAISFELDGQFPLPLDELATDHLAIKRGDGRGRALVVAAKRSTLDHVSARLKLADVDLRLVTTGALAIAQAMATATIPPLPAGVSSDLQAVSLILDLGYRSSELVAIGSAGPVGARSMRRGGRQLVRELKKIWRLDAEAAELALETDGTVDDPAVRRALQPLLREVEHTRQWLKAELGCQVTEIRISGGLSGLRGLGGWLASETGLEVGTVLPRETGTLRQVQGRNWSGTLVALGTALATGRRPLIQLHDAYETGGTEGAWFQQHFSTVAALGVAIVAFAGVDTMVRLRAAERERDAYAEELERETFSTFGVKLDGATAVRAKLSEAEGGATSNGIPERGALEVLEVITKAAAPKPVDPVEASPELPPGYTFGTDADGQPAVVGPDGMPVPLDSTGSPMLPIDPTGGPGGPPAPEAEDAPPVSLAPVSDTNAGILADDELQFSSVEIRDLKIELSLSARRATAQDRLGVKLGDFECIGEITKGMIKDRNDRKSFDMSLNHTCFTGSIAQKGGPTDGEG